MKRTLLDRKKHCQNDLFLGKAWYLAGLKFICKKPKVGGSGFCKRCCHNKPHAWKEDCNYSLASQVGCPGCYSVNRKEREAKSK